MSEKTAREHLPMSDYEKFLFDLKGFLVIPSVLTDEEIAIARDHVETYMKTPESLPEHHRSPISGPTEFLIDHPRVMGILQEVIDPDRERIRLESVFISGRSAEKDRQRVAATCGGNQPPPFVFLSLSQRSHLQRNDAHCLGTERSKKRPGRHLPRSRLAQSQSGICPGRNLA